MEEINFMSTTPSDDLIENWGKELPQSMYLSSSLSEVVDHYAKKGASYASQQWSKALTDFLGETGGYGDEPWANELDTPEKVIKCLRALNDYHKNQERYKWVSMILKFIQDHGGEVKGKWGEADPEWAQSALEGLLEVREQVAAESQLRDNLSPDLRTRLSLSEAKDKALGLLRDTDERINSESSCPSGGRISDDVFLYLCKSTIHVPIVAPNETEALVRFQDNYGLAVDSVMMQVPEAVVNEVVDRVYKLTPDSIWEGYVPHGDYYGTQKECSYYTIESHKERLDKKREKEDRMAALLEGLDEEDVETLKGLLLNEEEREGISLDFN